MKTNIISKLKDPVVWGLFFAFAKLLTSALGLDIAPESWTQWEEVFNAACGIAVALGIFSYNPNTRAKVQEK
ncbi:hypothetical protein IC619_015205 [Hazenella sp. IB182353]|uniref:hypothetical protein n=1 Tax=Polycladospora coralii TaxID=2771432 RepID=UPI00174789A2|nr:hypothetical protein [Polycladospora coralii]MBS7531819.1 hypothetical protein [Polycladospora coralii]